MVRGRTGGRNAVLDAAVAVFGRRGYEAATLEEIGAELGVSRSAVLYHFATKADLLASVVAPLLDDLDRVFDGIDDPSHGAGGDTGPPGRPHVRGLVSRTVDAVLAHHAAAALLWGDRTARGVGDPAGRLAAWSDRFAALTVGAAGGGARMRELALVRSLSALDVVAGAGIDGAAPPDTSTRRLLVEMTLNVLGTRLPGP